MIDNLRETTRANQEQDWLKTNLARFTGHMQGGRDLLDVTSLIVSELTPLVGATQGSFFLTEAGGDESMQSLRRIASYGYRKRDGVPGRVRRSARAWSARPPSRGRPCGHRRAARLRADLVRARARRRRCTIVILPVIFEEQVLGVVELASFTAVQRRAHATSSSS